MTYDLLSERLSTYSIDRLEKRLSIENSKTEIIDFTKKYQIQISFSEGYCEDTDTLYGMPEVFKLRQNKRTNEFILELTEFASKNPEVANCELLILISRLIFSLNPIDFYEYYARTGEHFREFMVFFLIYSGFGKYLLERNSIISKYKSADGLNFMDLRYHIPMNLDMIVHSVVYCNVKLYGELPNHFFNGDLSKDIQSKLRKSYDQKWW